MYTHTGYFLLSWPAGSHRAVQAQQCFPHIPLLLSAALLVPVLCRDTHIIIAHFRTIKGVTPKLTETLPGSGCYILMRIPA